MTLEDVVPWGRSYEAHLAMFDLSARMANVDCNPDAREPHGEGHRQHAVRLLRLTLVRQAKLGASCRVKVPVGEGS
jgi:hypothetical protein